MVKVTLLLNLGWHGQDALAVFFTAIAKASKKIITACHLFISSTDLNLILSNSTNRSKVLTSKKVFSCKSYLPVDDSTSLAQSIRHQS